MKRLLLATALFLGVCQPILADQHVPVKINACVMGYENVNDDTVIGQGVDFTNVAHHVITAIRFNFTYLTKFNEVLGGTLETDTGNFSPGIEINHTATGQSLASRLLAAGNNAPIATYHWQSANPSQEPLTNMKISCTVDAVIFQDGTVWHAPK